MMLRTAPNTPSAGNALRGAMNSNQAYCVKGKFLIRYRRALANADLTDGTATDLLHLAGRSSSPAARRILAGANVQGDALPVVGGNAGIA